MKKLCCIKIKINNSVPVVSVYAYNLKTKLIKFITKNL